jgi:hypothetical protein
MSRRALREFHCPPAALLSSQEFNLEYVIGDVFPSSKHILFWSVQAQVVSTYVIRKCPKALNHLNNIGYYKYTCFNVQKLCILLKNIYLCIAYKFQYN